jgi:tryptophan-rich sensory protein
VTTPEIPTWYAGLAKPKWTPPNWVFPVVWNILYLMMGLSLWLLWQADPKLPKRRRVLTLFLVQLALNATWSPVFFKLHQTKMALAIIVLLAMAIAATIITSWRIDRRAAALLIPYLAWIGYAATLNAGIVVFNP